MYITFLEDHLKLFVVSPEVNHRAESPYWNTGMMDKWVLFDRIVSQFIIKNRLIPILNPIFQHSSIPTFQLHTKYYAIWHYVIDKPAKTRRAAFDRISFFSLFSGGSHLF
jgi:hypothetical protein